MEQFIQGFQELVKKFCDSSNAFDDWKADQDFPESSTPPELMTQIQEFSSHHQQITQSINQLAYFFFREELLWDGFLQNPDAVIEDPVFEYKKAPFSLREAQCLHLLHQYSWYQVLKKIVQLDPVKGSLVFLLPPSGAQGELEQPDFLPECILMEACLYRENTLFYCWHVNLPDKTSFKLEEGESLVQLYDHMMTNSPPSNRVGIRDYLIRIRDNYEGLRNEKREFENHSSFMGSRTNENTHVYFLYWTQFYVYMCTLDKADLQPTIDTRIRKNSMIPINTVFSEGTNYRKFRLNFDEEIALHTVEEDIEEVNETKEN